MSNIPWDDFIETLCWIGAGVVVAVPVFLAISFIGGSI